MFSQDMRIERINYVSYERHPSHFGSFSDYSQKVTHNELIYKFDGKIDITFGDESFIEEAKCVRFLPLTDRRINYTCRTIEPSEYVYFSFDSVGAPDKMIRKNIAHSEKLEQLFMRLYHSWIMRQDGYYHHCMSIAYEILAELERQSYLPQEKFDKLIPAIKYIEDHLTDDIDFSNLHKLCSMSYTYFKQLFIAKYGMPPVKYVTKLRMNIACEQLANGMLSVGEISDMLGYANLHYFSRLFKSEIGCSATEYRNKHKIK
ncbi:MAG: helix-turn-helix transcriptional regulator [Clostridiales bacterium]|nr:helix-turn-helix transcriptional regulator [Clostridiales bacterium]